MTTADLAHERERELIAEAESWDVFTIPFSPRYPVVSYRESQAAAPGE